MKSLLVLAALAASASADTRVYDIKSVKPAGHYVSCSSTAKMMKDKHVLRIVDEREVWIDGFKWDPWTSADDPDMTASFHSTDRYGKSQKTLLIAQLYVSDLWVSGLYILQGRTSTGKECSNAVWVTGKRR